ncbi:hypothetical protein HII31_04968 [Pseudocercospora fuligena]|uniref:DUF3669 domain-containing protein n=1 Tax=Pseudocercospora fuligena TaxID=685502 RepID=A0A8H6RMU9_9PEZI|nr:hypothetical protein HII31_04968 [Pseudocercospora fuligena]
MHQKLAESVNEVRKIPGSSFTHLNLPEHRKLILASDMDWWTERIARFPEGYSPCNTLVTERIHPFPRPVREKLIDHFCPKQLRDQIKNNRSDEDCLVRPYLGRRGTTSSKFFTLRNRSLHIDQMTKLNLPVNEYAKVMADVLAICYWHAKIDANDMEFVLAPAGSHPESETWNSKVLGKHTMWILDFDCVKEISLDEAGVEQAALAFLRNDPYFPRPCGEKKEDRKLWVVFKERFLKTSSLILSGDSDLPGKFISRVEEMAERKRERMKGLNGHWDGIAV